MSEESPAYIPKRIPEPERNIVLDAYAIDDIAKFFGRSTEHFRRDVMKGKVRAGRVVLKAFQLLDSRKAPYYVDAELFSKFVAERKKVPS